MKGKNKILLVLFALCALVATGVGFALHSTGSVKYAEASEVSGFTAELEGGVIFSAERVYFTQADTTSDYTPSYINVATEEVGYGGYTFNQIETKDGSRYFGDFGLTVNEYDYSHKSIIRQGDFVMVDDNAKLMSGTQAIRQGIMITFGGYYWDEDANEYVTNKTTGEAPNEQENGAKISFVSAQAFLNGDYDNPLDLPGARGYTDGEYYEDFTWFIPATKANEGHYEISFQYMKSDGKNESEALKYEFDFYLLLQSSYTDTVQVSGQRYESKPYIDNAAVPSGQRDYEFNLGRDLTYPTLTFDYSRYDLTITHNSGDVTTTIDFDYDEAKGVVTLSRQVYNDIKVDTYKIGDWDNTIISLMFSEHGRYEFAFDYIYKYKGEKITIPRSQISFDNMILNIRGFQLKYSKAGFTSGADMTYLEIYQNNTMFVLLNGLINPNSVYDTNGFGIEYKLISSTDVKTGTIKDTSKTASFSPASSLEGLTEDELNKISYPKTDRGLWLSVNDEPQFSGGITESHYYYSTSRITTNNLLPIEDKKYIDINKVTTFTRSGYYLVAVKYKYTLANGEDRSGEQYFAFQITQATPVLNLHKTEKDVFSDLTKVDGEYTNAQDFYAYEYTNQNVFADWNDTEIFESTVVGKLYWSEGAYVDEKTLVDVADGQYNSKISKKDYNKNDFITKSASYLLVLEVQRSATKTYTYFTIDKDKISGLEVYEIASGIVDNHTIYRIKQDASLNYVKHTSKGIIDTSFTLDWADKLSGAKISATYKFTPFVKNNTKSVGKAISSNDNYYNYIINAYGVDKTSNAISISKPRALNVTIGVSDVLSDQGIYEFNIEDQAGNKLKYVVIIDKTEAVINATYGDADVNGEKRKYANGQMVADYVELEWGTHKAIDLSNLGENSSIIKELLELSKNNSSAQFEDYYLENTTNLNQILTLFKHVPSGEDLFVVEHIATNIKSVSFIDYYYRLRSVKPSSDKEYPETDLKSRVYESGNEFVGWDELADSLFMTTLADKKDDSGEVVETGTDADLKVLVDKDKLRRYTIEILGANNISNNANTRFALYITPDDALGEVYSSSQENADFNTNVLASGQTPKYFSETESYENINMTDYYEAQASNDGVFVFEWTNPQAGDNFEVVEVVYNYYQLMDQTALNNISKSDLNDGRYPYYPYKYSRTEYLLQLDEFGAEISAQYSTTTRTTSDGAGNNITRSINRTIPINLGYESYYNENQELVKRKVTQTGLYIITRTIEIEGSLSKFSYAFFVDRNMIVGYDINDVTTKLVGQFIHVAMPNSDSATGVSYDNFTKQGLPKNHLLYNDDKKGAEDFDYYVYLETNKLPTQLKVPSGKYVSGNNETEDKWDISQTSYININLRLSVYFVDSYKLLASPYNHNTIKLMDDYLIDEHSYIDLDFSKLNTGEVGTYNKARIHNNGDKYLSLPGTYVFVLKDNVGKEIDVEGGTWELNDHNQFVFGIKLLNNAPTTEVYAYASIDGKESSKIYSENMELYTNQQYVDFIIPDEDKESYMAQLDISTIEVKRKDLSTGAIATWLKLIRQTGGGFVVDSSGIEDTTKSIYYIDKDGKELAYGTSIDGFDSIGYKIKLDTGLEVKDGEIVSYKEYEYYVYISYILENSHTDYYTYQDSNIESLDDDKFADERLTTKTFYQSTYTVTIDRTPNDANLDDLMQQQGNYFKEYQQWLAQQNSTNFSGEVNKNFAYRSSTTIADYYGLTNAMYYEYAKQTGELSNYAMYALSVGSGDTFDISGLRSVYYREINFEDDIIARERMGLLPITDTYFTTSEYYTFNESTTAYTKGFLQSSNNTTNKYMNLFNMWTSDDDLIGKFYEIVEIDNAGNYTQYVIYYTNSSVNPQIEVVGTYISGSSTTESVLVEFNSTEPYTFIGIDCVGDVTDLASQDKNTEKYEQYYANINIYDASRNRIKTIYTNSKSTHAEYSVEEDDYTYTTNGIEKELYEIIKNEGNYIVEFVNTFGRRYSVVINNYTDNTHQLNTATFAVKKDVNGNCYLTFSELNTKINKDTFWYVTNIEIKYGENRFVKYTASLPDANGITTLSKNSAETDEVRLSESEKDRVDLAKNISYTIILKDVGRKIYAIPVSTIKDYYAYEMIAPSNSYIKDNVVYTAGAVNLSYDKNLYECRIEVLNEDNMSVSDAYDTILGETHDTVTLKPDENVNPTYLGSLRKFTIELSLKNADTAPAQTYVVYIDTRATRFTISNLNKEDKSQNIKSRIKNSGEDYNMLDFINPKYDNEGFFGELINETIIINWTDGIENDYFNYRYELFEFKSANEWGELLQNTREKTYSISPNDKTTGKYIFKVTIVSKDGQWIASRVYGIHMSTTVTGLYEVTDALGNVYNAYSAITNLTEILKSFNMSLANIQRETKLAEDLEFEPLGADSRASVMQKTFNSFGTQTAIPMYISNGQLLLQSNKDNGVDASCYTATMTNGTVIKFYRVYRSNYQTFVVLMEVPFTRTGILSTFEFATKDLDSEGKKVDPTNLLGAGMSKTIYDANAQFYRLEFSSYNKNAGNNPLEQHNKIVINVYYNNKQVNSLIGGSNPTTEVYFKNSGSYKLEIKDMAGNIQYFTAATSSVPSFLLVVMKDVLYTINAEAPIQYAYYDEPVKLQIDRQNNYDINTINLTAILNSRPYTGYEHPTGTSEYTFKDYGTYLITISAKLLNREEVVTSQLVFTILNPNEARRALDFTSICGYDIISVERVYDSINTTTDVTSTFMTLLQDKANDGDINVYNRLITYERVVDAFKVPAEGKMKFKVSYRVQDDVLLPARYADFTFTLNNETATINSSIAPGGKTTKPVVLEFTAANIYDLVGDCYLVINGEKLEPKIDQYSPETITRITLSGVGHYYVQLVSDSGNVITSFNFTIKEPLNTVSIILIVIVSAIVIGLVGTFVWLRTRMKVR